MVVVPNSEIRLLKTPFEMNDSNQLTFSSKQAQYNYFNSLPNQVYDGLTYIRQDGVVRYEGNFDELLGYNYCMYQNKSYSDKWFYAYITDIKYISDEVTYITIETDVFQTWQFDIVYKNSFVEREHVNDDGRYKNTVEEDIYFGDYVNDTNTNFSFLNDSKLVMMSTVSPTDASIQTGGIYNGIYGACKLYCFRNETALTNALNRIATAGRSDGIVGLFLVPEWLVDFNSLVFNNEGIAGVPETTEVKTSEVFAIPLNSNSIGGYTPKNNKLFNAPYNTFVLDNNNGSCIELKPQNFTYDTNHTSGLIQAYGVITPGCEIKVIPLNYNGNSEYISNLPVINNTEYGLNMGKLPICSYNVDMYTNWLTQNSVNQTIGMVTSSAGVLGGIASMATGNPFGGASMMASGVMGIAQTIGAKEIASLMPDEARGNVNSADLMYAMDMSVTIHYKHARVEYLRILDDYFSMFGYKVNRLKIPNVTGRPNWNYVKCIDVNLIGDIPQKDLEKIRNMFNNGTTFWHNPNTFLDYSVVNK